MSRSLLLSLLTLLSCFRVLSGSFAEKESSACRDGSLRSSKKMKRARKKEGMDSISNTQVAIDKHDSERHLIQCRMCHLMFPGEKCSRGRGVCTTTAEEACAIGMLYKADRTLWLSFMGCLKNCANVQNIKWSVYFVTFKCCRGYDLCNDDL
ncbi:prostate and testis expressed protein 1-like isoform X1 [Dipodomys merriami]|uniref:prostate and testis expressed protein 1 isoform X1 n=1 Tax=Dipodomys merriami TaxID=94247 RepID=UPI0038559E82